MVIKEKAIVSVKGTAIPKPANDQNTDDIVPGRYLKEITFKNMGNYVYFDERFKNRKIVENYPFNNANYKDASILIAGANYGCGSSREHAPQALKRFGINAIIAESFAEIFAGNCASLGIVTATVSSKSIAELVSIVEKNPSTEFDINLEEKTISHAGEIVMFEIPEGRRRAFLNGTWDAMAILARNQKQIEKAKQRIEYLSFK